MSTNEGYMIVNGKKVEGRSLSFDSEGLKVGNSGDEKVAVPNGGFNFAEDSNSDNGECDACSELSKKKILDKNFLLGLGIGTVVGIVGSYFVYKFMNKE